MLIGVFIEIMKKYKNKIICITSCFVILIVLFFLFGKFERINHDTENETVNHEEYVNLYPDEENNAEVYENDIDEKTIITDKDPDFSKVIEDEKNENIVREENKEQETINKDNADNASETQTCTMSVTCKTILNNIEEFNKEKIEILPDDGVIFAEQVVEFYEGESVFNLLRREMKKNKIHMEFVNTPVYGSSYIEGIANIYEFDCGELSGWMYKVNDEFPNYGCSLYKLKQGDKVEWIYTCDLGRDVGGDYYFGGQKSE